MPSAGCEVPIWLSSVLEKWRIGTKEDRLIRLFSRPEGVAYDALQKTMIRQYYQADRDQAHKSKIRRTLTSRVLAELPSTIEKLA